MQSGLRTTPALQTFRDPSGGTTGHTGTYVDTKRNGIWQYTSGQAAAHDKLRENLANEITKNEGVPEVVEVNLLVGHLDVTPTGRELFADPKLKGITSNVITRSSGEFFALVDRGREEAKARARGLKDTIPLPDRKRARSPSPSRYRVTSSGGGGGYSQKREVTPAPEFPKKSKLAHEGAWATQPLRLPK
jgi:hypothetical protein